MPTPGVLSASMLPHLSSLPVPAGETWASSELDDKEFDEHVIVLLFISRRNFFAAFRGAFRDPHLSIIERPSLNESAAQEFGKRPVLLG